MKRKITILVSLLFLLSGGLLADGLEVRDDIDLDAEEEASSVDDVDIFLGLSRSGSSRGRQVRRKLSVKLLRGFHARTENSLPAGRIDGSSPFAQLSRQELYKLQQTYRI